MNSHTDPRAETICAEFIAGASYEVLAARYMMASSSIANIVRGRTGISPPRAARDAHWQGRVGEIAKITGHLFRLRPGEIWSDSKPERIVEARFAAWLVANEAGASLAAIARAFEMDHTTISHGCRRAKEIAAEYPYYRKKIEALRALAVAA